MINEMDFAGTDIQTIGMMYRPSKMKKRSLGGAIFLAAIADYCSTEEQEHRSAERFLYPQTSKWQEHYDWAVALAEGVNPAWLREALDRFKDKWDGQRAKQIARKRRRALKSSLKSHWRSRRNEEQRHDSDGRLLPTDTSRSCDASVQPPRAACSARTGDVAPGL
jgi:hypothetical protein